MTSTPTVDVRRMMTLNEMCIAAVQAGAIPDDLAHLHTCLATIVKTIAAAVARVGIDDLSGYISEEADGSAGDRDRQKKLDVVAVCFFFVGQHVHVVGPLLA